MKKILTMLFALVSLSVCAQGNFTDASGKKQGKGVKKYESGKTRYTGTFKNDIPVGTFTYYFEREGGKMSEIFYRGTTGVG